MINRRTGLSLGFVALCAIQSPAWAINDGGGPTETVVYATGHSSPSWDPSGSEAVVWANDFSLPMSLTNTPDALVSAAQTSPAGYSITVKGTSVYVSGRSLDASGQWKATVWKNGAVLAQYPGATTPVGVNSFAQSIAFNGSDMYVVGDRAHRALGTIWKNGVATALAGGSAVTPTSIAVTGPIAPTIYVAGSDSNGAVANLWKNNVLYQLSAIGTATDVEARGGYAYVAGVDRTMAGANPRAVYWKFDPATNAAQATALSDGTHFAIATAVAVSGSNVYVAGVEEDDSQYYQAKLWINGVAQVLGGGGQQHAEATSIFIHGTDVYVGGYLNLSPVVWKNGAIYMYDETVEGAVQSLYVADVPYAPN